MSVLEKNAVLSAMLDQHLPRLAAYEELSEAAIRQAVDQGRMVLLANPAHRAVEPVLIGQPARIKVNANIGTSPLINDATIETQKLRLAKTAGAHTVMDLSTAGRLVDIRAALLAESPLPLGTVPLYSVAQKHIVKGRDPSEFGEDEIIEEIALQAEAGVDFMTLHCGVTRRGATLALAGGRLTGIVSRGGSILARWMKRKDRENPYYTRYDDILDICLRHNVTISLGDGLRPGCGADAGDAAQWDEVAVLGELCLRARARGVQTMIEGPGHVPLHLVPGQIQGVKRLTHDAPLYVLGPLTTDSAAGHDHIAGAIGGALAGYHGADFLCYLTPAEHLTLPGPDDVWEGIKASLVAAQSAEVALGRPWATRRDAAISKARADLDWDAMTREALDPQKVRKRREAHNTADGCAMCGDFCAIRMADPNRPAGAKRHC